MGEVCQVFDGPHATPTRRDSGPVFLGIGSLANGRLNLAASDHISEEDFAKWTRRVTPQPGDVVFSYETRLGEAAIIPPGLRCCLGRRMALMRPDPKRVDSRYLLYHYLGPEFQEVIRQRTIHGSTVDRIALVEFPKFPLRLPPLEEQRRIAEILGALDDKIELNRRMNATLEAMAQALFTSWFVDFDPVRAKLDGRQPAGLDSEIAALFPDSFQDTELGHLPTGWTIARIDQIAIRIAMGPFGSRITRDNYVPDGVPVVRGRNLTDGFVDAGFVFLTQNKAKELRSAIARPLDVVFTHRGTLGQVGIIPRHPRYSRYVVSQSQMLLSIDPQKLRPWAAYLFFRSPLGQAALLANTSITGVPAISRPTTTLRAIRIALPPQELSRAFDGLAEPLFRERERLARQARDLGAARDTLVPHLLSGKLDLSPGSLSVGEAS